jgi:iduronate 2-sulfatase
MFQRLFLTLSVCALFSPAFSVEKARNVLLIASDDLCTALGSYGHPLVKSPNIDKLASRGVLFKNAYCQFPLCNPSRASFLTGRMPSVTKVLNNRPNFRDAIPDTVTLPQLFKNSGIFTARVGKLYHYGVPGDIGTPGMDDPASWNETVNPRGVDKDVEEEIHTTAPPTAKGSGRFGGQVSWLSVADDRGEHTDGIGAAEGIKLLEAHKDKPFFLAVGFYRPHTPYVAPKKYFDLYPLDKIKLPETPAGFKEQTPALAITTSPNQEAMTDQQRKEAIQAYHASTSYMDAQVGRLIDAVDRLGLAKNTVIVFVSDHGYHLGEYGMWQKQSLFEQSARVPLIIAAPGAKKNGTATEALVESLDIYPTVAALCGLEAPKYLDGKSLVPVLDGDAIGVREHAYTQVQRGDNKPGHAVRTVMYRYIEWSYGADGAQLYDMEKDPFQTKNLANDPAYAQPRAELSAMIQERWPKSENAVAPTGTGRKKGKKKKE